MPRRYLLFMPILMFFFKNTVALEIVSLSKPNLDIRVNCKCPDEPGFKDGPFVKSLFLL